MNKKVLWLFGTGFLSILICLAAQGYAQESSSDESASGPDTDWQQQLSSDKQAVMQQKQAISQNAQAAKAEEQQFKQQIQDAINRGDTATAQALHEQLQASRQGHMQQKVADKQALYGAKQEFKADAQAAKQAGYMPPKKGHGPQMGPGQQGQGPGNPPGYNPPGRGQGNPPGYNPPGQGQGNPPGYNPPGKGAGNPPGYNPPGKGQGNPPGYNPPGKGQGGPKPAGGGRPMGGGRR